MDYRARERHKIFFFEMECEDEAWVIARKRAGGVRGAYESEEECGDESHQHADHHPELRLVLAAQLRVHRAVQGPGQLILWLGICSFEWRGSSRLLKTHT